MYLIDFNSASGNALSHAFMKGLGAPAMLFHTERAPAIPALTLVTPPSRTDLQAIQNDWLSIGTDIKKTIDAYEHNASTK